MWVFLLLASISGYALIKTLVRNHKYDSFIKDLRAKGGLSYKERQEHKILKAGGNDIHYFISGKEGKDLLIFIPAAFCDHQIFDHQVQFFSENYRVVTIDLIGHGLSQVNVSADQMDTSADHLLQILALERYKKAHLIGVSMGSLVAQYFAFLYPEKVHSVTVTGGYCIHRDNRDLSKAQIFEKLNWPLKILFSMDSFRRYVASKAVVKPEEQAKVYESTKLFTRRSFRVMQGLTKMDAVPTKRPHYPLLMLVGEYDLKILMQYTQKWHSEDPEASFHVIKDAGHNANMDNPEDFNRILDTFIKTKAKLRLVAGGHLI